MNNYTREDILRMVEEEDVGFIRLQFTDMYGTLKNVAITSSQLEKALDNEWHVRWFCPLKVLREWKIRICIFARI